MSEDDRTKEEKLQDFSYEWLVEMDKDSLRSLGVFLCNVFTSDIGMKLTESAELSARIVGKSDRTVRQWRTDIIDDKGKLTHTKQGLQGATVEREFCGS